MKKRIVLCFQIIFFIYLSILSLSLARPILNDVSPNDGARLDSNPVLIVNVSDDKPINIVWYFRVSGANHWEKIGQNLSVPSGIYQQNIPNGTKEGINYQWSVNISDNTSYINNSLNFRRRGWQTIFEITNITFYAPDSSKNISLYTLEGENAFHITFGMKFYVYNGTILVKNPGRLDEIPYTANENGIYEDISLDIKKDKPIFFPPGYEGNITITRPDGLQFSFDTIYITKHGSWNVEIIGRDNQLNFRIFYATDWSRVIIYIIFLLIPILFNIISWKKKIWEKEAIDSTMLIIPAIFFPLLTSDIPPQSVEMIFIYILSGLCSVISFFHWKTLRKNKLKK